MTIRYISPANDGGFNASGVSIVQIQVPSGQYWLPRLIKVGMLGLPTSALSSRPFVPRLITRLYHGTPTDMGPSAFVDATVNTVTGDVTSVLNGTMLQPGEWITAVTSALNLDTWTQGLVYLELDGLTTDSIDEAAQLVASSVPGPAFRGQIAYPMALPPMPDRSGVHVFFNPGQNNAVNLIASVPNSNLFIYNISIVGLTTPTVPGGDGAFQPNPPTSPPGVLTDQFGYYDPYTANASIDFEQDYHGYQMLPGGLQWFQIGPATANTLAYGTSVASRFMNI